MEQQAIYTESEHYKCLEDLRLVSDFSEVDSLVLDYCGIEDCRPGFQLEPYIRKSYLMHVVFGGKGTYTSGGKTYNLKAGDLFFIYPGQLTKYRADVNDPWTYGWIGFHGFRAEEIARKMGLTREQPVRKTDRLGDIRTCVDRMLMANSLSWTDQLLRISGMLVIFAFLSEGIGEDTEGMTEQSSEYVKKGIDFIRKNYMKDIKVNQIAESIGISRSYLTKVFHKAIFLSPQEYLINLRAQQAAYLLKQTDASIKEIAYSCGYSDGVSFSKSFKKMYGMSPRQYRDIKEKIINMDEKHDMISVSDI